LLKQTVLRDFAELWPGKFCNVTNGVTPRRFVAVSNPSLTQLITERIGDGWLQDPHQLRALELLADDAEFQQQWRDVKRANKRHLGTLIAERIGIVCRATVFRGNGAGSAAHYFVGTGTWGTG
jgi:starch phosphorylase